MKKCQFTVQSCLEAVRGVGRRGSGPYHHVLERRGQSRLRASGSNGTGYAQSRSSRFFRRFLIQNSHKRPSSRAAIGETMNKSSREPLPASGST
jgi:hypothetical protein